MRASLLWPLAACVWPALAPAAPLTYRIDPNHTHPSFEVDHFAGLSTWRGLFKSASGTITLDRERRTGTVEVLIDVSSIEFGHDKLDQMVQGEKIGDWNGLDVARYPNAIYKGTLSGFRRGAPTRVAGELTLHGVTRPLTLRIGSFKCIANHPLIKREVCGADASGSFSRATPVTLCCARSTSACIASRSGANHCPLYTISA